MTKASVRSGGLMANCKLFTSSCRKCQCGLWTAMPTCDETGPQRQSTLRAERWGTRGALRAASGTPVMPSQTYTETGCSSSLHSTSSISLPLHHHLPCWDLPNLSGNEAHPSLYAHPSTQGRLTLIAESSGCFPVLFLKS